MPAQAIAMIRVNNPKLLGQYREKAGAALAKHDGRVVTAGPPAGELEAALETPDIVALLEFPTIEHAKAWHADPELAEVHELRRSAGGSTILLLPQ